MESTLQPDHIFVILPEDGNFLIQKQRSMTMAHIFTELELATREQYDHGDLPKWLADPVFHVARNPSQYAEKEYLVEILLDQVREYDVYAEAGCCKWAYDHEDIARTLRWLAEGQ